MCVLFDFLSNFVSILLDKLVRIVLCEDFIFGVSLILIFIVIEINCWKEVL